MKEKSHFMIQPEARIRNFRSQPRNLRGAVTMMLEDKHAGNGSLVGKSQHYLGENRQVNGKPATNGRGEDSVKQEANGKCDTPRKILKVYSWQEIQKHHQESDQWLVISRKVYDVTGWAKRHPGGHRVLSHYAGEDATVRSSELCPLSSSCWVDGTWLSSQKYFKYVLKCHNFSSPPTPIFQDSYPART